ncbi:MAG: hypothetical protein WKG00_11725 [Polyangiaceae bacterium]
MPTESFREFLLQKLDAESLACEAVEAVLSHLDCLTLHLFPPEQASALRIVSQKQRATEQWRDTALTSQLGLAVRGLTEFAQGRDIDGGAVPEWIRAILDTLLRLAAADDGFHPTDAELTRYVSTQGALAAALTVVLAASRRRISAARPTLPDADA